MYDVYRVREDFPVLKEVTYLDSAATSQKPLPVVAAVDEYFTKYCGSYSRGAHRLSRLTTEKYEDARDAVAGLLQRAVPERRLHPEHHGEREHGGLRAGLEEGRPRGHDGRRASQQPAALAAAPGKGRDRVRRRTRTSRASCPPDAIEQAITGTDEAHRDHPRVQLFRVRAGRACRGEDRPGPWRQCS